jgi:hypothetical protein
MTKYFTLSAKTTSLIIIILCVYSCREQELSEEKVLSTRDIVATTNNNIANQTASFTRSVGKPVDGTIGQKWIENYKKANGRDFEFYILKAEAFQNILSNSSCIGISLHYAKDDEGNHHIIPIGVDLSGALMKSEKNTLSSGEISWDIGQQWISNSSGIVRSHFFGANTFNRLLIDGGALSIRMTKALDDNNKTQLLLSDAGKMEIQSYEDASSPCPTVCPK